MGRLEIVTLGKFLDFVRCQRIKKFPHQLAQECVSQTVDALEMFKEQDQPFEVRRVEFSVDAVERMRHGVGDFSALQISLQRKNIVTNDDNVRVLLFGDAPDQDVDLAGVLREISRDLFTDESVRQVANFQTTIDCVVIRDGDEIHSALE